VFLLQDQMLKQLQQSGTPVAIYLISGIKLQGKISQFDAHTILLLGQGVQLIYKQAISTILPQE